MDSEPQLASQEEKSDVKPRKKATPRGRGQVPKKTIDTLDSALERIDELEQQLKSTESKITVLKQKHTKKIDTLREEWNDEVKKLEVKKTELTKKLRQKNNALKKDKSEMKEVLAILDKSIRD